jgi:hypothetical protein
MPAAQRRARTSPASLRLAAQVGESWTDVCMRNASFGTLRGARRSRVLHVLGMARFERLQVVRAAPARWSRGDAVRIGGIQHRIGAGPQPDARRYGRKKPLPQAR